MQCYVQQEWAGTDAQQKRAETDLKPISAEGKPISGFDFRVKLGPLKMFGEAYHVLICCLLYQHSWKYKIGVHIVEPNFKKVDEWRPFNDIKKLFEWYDISTTSTGNSGDCVSKSKATDMIAALFRSDDGLDPKNLFDHICDRLSDPFRRGGLTVLEIADQCLMKYFEKTNQYLPNYTEVLSLAVIHIRGGDAETAAGRIMDATTLKYVENSIADVNMLCSRLGCNSKPAFRFTPFTHVMLYGDFDYSEGRRMVNDMKGRHGNLHFSHISGPWRRESVPMWEQFHSEEFENIPTQAKILGIWTALRQRYQNQVCVIGHRSGFIEGAGLIGIPIFYLNNERDKYPGEFKGRNPLWNRVPDAHQDRLRGLADALNTFIPIEVLIKNSSQQKVVDFQHKHELTAALFMYMCCPYIIDEGDVLENYAWTTRIHMIHDECEHVKPGKCVNDGLVDGESHTYQFGEEWLRRRYKVARSFLNSSKKASWQPEFRLMQENWEREFKPAWVPKKASKPPEAARPLKRGEKPPPPPYPAKKERRPGYQRPTHDTSAFPSDRYTNSANQIAYSANQNLYLADHNAYLAEQDEYAESLGYSMLGGHASSLSYEGMQVFSTMYQANQLYYDDGVGNQLPDSGFITTSIPPPHLYRDEVPNDYDSGSEFGEGRHSDDATGPHDHDSHYFSGEYYDRGQYPDEQNINASTEQRYHRDGRPVHEAESNWIPVDEEGYTCGFDEEEELWISKIRNSDRAD